MRITLNEYYDEIMKPSLRWLNDHRKGIIPVFYVIAMTGLFIWIWRSDDVKSLIKFLKKEVKMISRKRKRA